MLDMKVRAPLVRVLRLVDGDDKPTITYIYEVMVQANMLSRTFADIIKGIEVSLTRDETFSCTPIYMLPIKLIFFVIIF